MPESLVAALGEPLAWTAALYTGLGLLLFGTGLQRGSATTVCASSMAVETLVPAAIGVLLVGDQARAGFGPVALLGLLITLLAALSLTVGREQRVPSMASADT